MVKLPEGLLSLREFRAGVDISPLIKSIMVTNPDDGTSFYAGGGSTVIIPDNETRVFHTDIPNNGAVTVKDKTDPATNAGPVTVESEIGGISGGKKTVPAKNGRLGRQRLTIYRWK